MFQILADVAAQAAPEAAQTAAKQPGMKDALMQMAPLFIIVIVFMLFMSRSQKKQQQKRQEMLDKVVKGTTVLLQSGIYGKVAEVQGNTVLVEIADNVRIKVALAGIADVDPEKNAEAKNEEQR